MDGEPAAPEVTTPIDRQTSFTNQHERPVEIESQPNIGTVVFILSSDRSGSTWLGYVLGSTPNASFLGEFRRAWDEELRQPCAWCTANGRDACEVLANVELYPAERAFEVAFSRTRKQVLVDSSKRTAWAEKFVAPNSHFKVHFIHLIRDPRGWYASENRRHPRGLTEMMGEWVLENLHIRNFLELSNVPSTTVFYEDLAKAPVPTFQRLCHEIGCPFDPSALHYWEKPHHSFAANGASSPLLRNAPDVSRLSSFISGDDHFYETNDRNLFFDQRWKEQLSQADALAISEDYRVAAFLNLYDRVLTADSLHHLTVEERSRHRSLDGKFIRATGETPQLEKIYLMRAGIRHWVMSMQFIERVSRKWPEDLEILPFPSLERIPIGSWVRD